MSRSETTSGLPWTRFGTGLVGAVTLMMILTSAAGAAHPATNASAPFRGVVSLSESVNVNGGCAKAKLTTQSYFSLRSGTGGFSGGDAASTCSKSYATNAGQVLGGFAAYLNAPFHKGATTVYLNGTYALSGTFAGTSGNCKIFGSPSYAYCDTYEAVYVTGLAYWDDLSTGSLFLMGYLSGSASYLIDNYTDNQTYWGGAWSNSSHGTVGAFAASGSFALAYTLATNMVKSHRYAVFVDVNGNTFAEVFDAHGGGHVSFTGATAASLLNFATAGNGVTITSIGES